MKGFYAQCLFAVMRHRCSHRRPPQSVCCSSEGDANPRVFEFPPPHSSPHPTFYKLTRKADCGRGADDCVHAKGAACLLLQSWEKEVKGQGYLTLLPRREISSDKQATLKERNQCKKVGPSSHPFTSLSFGVDVVNISSHLRTDMFVQQRKVKK